MESGFTEFFQQIPPIAIICLCGSAVALLVVLILIVTGRTRRGRSAPVMTTPTYSPGAATSELPDLDLLIGSDDDDDSPPIPPPSVEAPIRPTVAATPMVFPEEPAPVTAAPDTAPEPVKPKAGGTYTIQLTAGENIQAAEVMTIARDISNGSLIIQIDDHAYRSVAEIEGSETRRRFAAAVRELARQTAEVTRPAGSSSRRANIPPPPTGGAMPGDLPKFRTDETPLLAPRKRNQPPPPPVPEINIADAIEAYLQYKIANTPEYEDRNVHVHPTTGGGVKIEVDGDYYDAVDEIEDDEVRDFLAAAIQEWQSRQ